MRNKFRKLPDIFSTIKRIVKECTEIVQWKSKEDQRAEQCSRKCLLQENIDLIRASVAEKPKMAVSRRHIKLGSVKPHMRFK